jgi:hypothetical protein
VLIGAGIVYYQSQLAQQATNNQIKATYAQIDASLKSSHDQITSQQVAKGFEQLANEKIVLRLGGIYSLEGVMNTSEQYHEPVLEALCAFVRDGAKAKVMKNKTESATILEPPPTDILYKSWPSLIFLVAR